MVPKLLTEDVCNPLPWKLDKLHGIVDRDGYPIGLGGTEAQRQAFIDWLNLVPELVTEANSDYMNWLANQDAGPVPLTAEVLQSMEGALVNEDYPDPICDDCNGEGCDKCYWTGKEPEDDPAGATIV